MTQKTTKLSSQGQITVPANFIKLAGLVKGELVEIRLDGDNIILTKKANFMNKYIGVLKDTLDLTTEEYLKIRKEEAKLP